MKLTLQDFMLLSIFGALVLFPFGIWGLTHPPSRAIIEATACCVGVWFGILAQIIYAAHTRK